MKKSILPILYFALVSTISFAQSSDWKQEARKRIDSIRKNDFTIQITDSKGNPLSDVTLDIKLVKHDFYIGAVVDDDFITSKHSDVYKSNLLKYFNSSGFENALKQKRRNTEVEKTAEQTAVWFSQNGISFRGHALVYDGEKFLRPEEKEILLNNTMSNSQKLSELIPMLDKHIVHGMKKWDVIAWDVLNEPLENHAVDDLTKENLITHWFKKAYTERILNNKLNTTLYINENRIISGTTPDTYERPERYRKIIEQCLKEGAPIEGIGFQSRIKNGMLSAKEMYDRLNYFNEFNLPYQATEFEIRSTDKFKYSDEQVKELTEQFMLIYFSHPKVEGIWHWTFNDTKNNSKPWALFNYDGTPTATGIQWISTLQKDFSTNEIIKTSSNGSAEIRGFRGVYEIVVKRNNVVKTVKYHLSKNDTLTIQL